VGEGEGFTTRVGVKNKTTGQAQSAWPKGYLEVEVTCCVQRKKNS